MDYPSFPLRRSDSPRVRIHSREPTKPGGISFCPPALPASSVTEDSSSCATTLPFFSDSVMVQEAHTNLSSNDPFGRSMPDDDPCKVVVRDLVESGTSPRVPSGYMSHQTPLTNPLNSVFTFHEDSCIQRKFKTGEKESSGAVSMSRSRDDESRVCPMEEEEEEVERILITDSGSEEQREDKGSQQPSQPQQPLQPLLPSQRVGGAGLYTETITLVPPSPRNEHGAEVAELQGYQESSTEVEGYYYASPDVLLTPPHTSNSASRSGGGRIRRASLSSPLPKQPFPLPSPAWANTTCNATPGRVVSGSSTLSFTDKITQSNSQNTFHSHQVTPFRPSTSTHGLSTASQRPSGADSLAPAFPASYGYVSNELNGASGGGVGQSMPFPPPVPNNGEVFSMPPSPFVMMPRATPPMTHPATQLGASPFPVSPANLSFAERSTGHIRMDLRPHQPAQQDGYVRRADSQQRYWSPPLGLTPPSTNDENNEFHHLSAVSRHHQLPPPMNASYFQQSDGGGGLMGTLSVPRSMPPPSPPMVPLGPTTAASAISQSGSGSAAEMPPPWVIPPNSMQNNTGLIQPPLSVLGGRRPMLPSPSQPSSTAATPQRHRDPSSFFCPSPPPGVVDGGVVTANPTPHTAQPTDLPRSCSSSFTPIAPCCGSGSGSPNYSFLPLNAQTVNSTATGAFSHGSKKAGKGKARQGMPGGFNPGRPPHSTYSYEVSSVLHMSTANLNGGRSVTPLSLSPSRHTNHRLSVPPSHQSALSVLMADAAGSESEVMEEIAGKSVGDSVSNNLSSPPSFSVRLSASAVQQVLSMSRDQLGCRTLQTLLVKDVYGIDDEELKRLEALQQEEETLQQQKQQVQQSAGSPNHKSSNGKPPLAGVHQVYTPSPASYDRFLSSQFVQRLVYVLTTALGEVAQDPYGNFLLQKLLLLAPSSERQKLLLHNSLYPFLPTVACSVHGTFPIQCWIDTIQSTTGIVNVNHASEEELDKALLLFEEQEQEMKLMVEGLVQNMPLLLMNVNGGHVLAKLRHHFLAILDLMNQLHLLTKNTHPKSNAPLVKSAQKLFHHQGKSLHDHLKVLHQSILIQLPSVCCQQQGSCAIQRWLEFFAALPDFMKPFFSEGGTEVNTKVQSTENSREDSSDPFISLAEAITAVSVALAPDPYANYVLTRLLDLYVESYLNKGLIKASRAPGGGDQFLSIPDRLVRIIIHSEVNQPSSQSYLQQQQQRQHNSNLLGMGSSHGRLSALTDLCCNKYASNVIEKLLRCSSETTVRALCRLWMTPIVVCTPYPAGAAGCYPDSSPILHTQESQSGPPYGSTSPFYGSSTLSPPGSASGRNGNAPPFIPPMHTSVGPQSSKYPLIAIALNSYGNYVIQTLLTVAPLDELVYPLRKELCTPLSPDSFSVSNTGSGVHLPPMPSYTGCYESAEEKAARLGILPLLQLYSSVWRSMSFGKKMETKIIEATARVTNIKNGN